MSVLHAYYAVVLTRTVGSVFTPVSRSEFGDVMGMLEVVGLASLSSSSSSLASRSLSRSASFGGAGGKGRGFGMGSQEVKIAEGVRCDELLRGLGIEEGAGPAADIREEEVRTIWQREKTRLGRDIKAAGAAGKGVGKGDNAFLDAVED